MPTVAVAYSGGRDSTALLHATIAAGKASGVAVQAMHVHHGLSPNADLWLDHCRRTCERWRRRGHAVGFRARRLDGGPSAGESVEAWAREHRYRALASLAHEVGAGLVLLAHHRRDQAETFVLQALRGAGAAGLAAMPATFERHGVGFARPWLEHDPQRIAAYAKRHRLRWIEDESNLDPRFARSRLRGEVWPALQGAFADADVGFARSARAMADAAAVLDEIGEADVLTMVSDGRLRVAAWASLSPPRRRNALRVWLRRTLDGPAPASLLERLNGELGTASSARWPCAGGELRLQRGELRLARPVSPSVSGARVLRFDGWNGELRIRPVDDGGLPESRLGRIEARARQGAETFQFDLDRPPRRLKKQFQAAGIDRWQRDAPLLFDGNVLLFVPGLGVDARVRAAPGEPQVALEWKAEAGLR